MIFGPVVGIGEQVAHARDIEVECSVFREGEATAADKVVFVGSSGDGVASEILDRVFTDRTTIERPAAQRRF